VSFPSALDSPKFPFLAFNFFCSSQPRETHFRRIPGFLSTKGLSISARLNRAGFDLGSRRRLLSFLPLAYLAILEVSAFFRPLHLSPCETISTSSSKNDGPAPKKQRIGKHHFLPPSARSPRYNFIESDLQKSATFERGAQGGLVSKNFAFLFNPIKTPAKLSPPLGQPAFSHFFCFFFFFFFFPKVSNLS